MEIFVDETLSAYIIVVSPLNSRSHWKPIIVYVFKYLKLILPESVCHSNKEGQ